MESVCDDWPSSEDDSLLTEVVCTAVVNHTVTLVWPLTLHVILCLLETTKGKFDENVGIQKERRYEKCFSFIHLIRAPS